ncbi:hypothetical protein BCR37DRAFT_379418 [Protomyces lactucae-debilis]|uniref:Secreted protein n=1 Tax=Protomyces lactucae-debilis TaxID=2754530 RepID=A0A1Y2FEV3_PROLT|nr:uncharacterized protein BCR37DRAFT_379418 [Protomyces lactucae-debilis]ORY82453.1 hypothetical protein BCR37DRAFT_379418 [Protomyces lactucae-debilis]
MCLHVMVWVIALFLFWRAEPLLLPPWIRTLESSCGAAGMSSPVQQSSRAVRAPSSLHRLYTKAVAQVCGSIVGGRSSIAQSPWAFHLNAYGTHFRSMKASGDLKSRWTLLTYLDRRSRWVGDDIFDGGDTTHGQDLRT